MVDDSNRDPKRSKGPEVLSQMPSESKREAVILVSSFVLVITSGCAPMSSGYRLIFHDVCSTAKFEVERE